MSPPLYSVVRHHYPTRAQYLRGQLLELLGWDDLLNNSAFEDTCAMRMSYGLTAAGVRLTGARMSGKAGLVKGLPIEPGQADLSRILRRLWGEPEIYRGEDAARADIGKRSGVVSFFRIHPESSGNQGHIDLVEPRANGFAECAMQCYFGAREVWFWPLK
jgi:hypothetical protein